MIEHTKALDLNKYQLMLGRDSLNKDVGDCVGLKEGQTKPEMTHLQLLEWTRCQEKVARKWEEEDSSQVNGARGGEDNNLGRDTAHLQWLETTEGEVGWDAAYRQWLEKIEGGGEDNNLGKRKESVELEDISDLTKSNQDESSNSTSRAKVNYYQESGSKIPFDNERKLNSSSPDPGYTRVKCPVEECRMALAYKSLKRHMKSLHGDVIEDLPLVRCPPIFTNRTKMPSINLNPHIKIEDEDSRKIREKFQHLATLSTHVVLTEDEEKAAVRELEDLTEWVTSLNCNGTTARSCQGTSNVQEHFYSRPVNYIDIDTIFVSDEVTVKNTRRSDTKGEVNVENTNLKKEKPLVPLVILDPCHPTLSIQDWRQATVEDLGLSRERELGLLASSRPTPCVVEGAVVVWLVERVEENITTARYLVATHRLRLELRELEGTGLQKAKSITRTWFFGDHSDDLTRHGVRQGDYLVTANPHIQRLKLKPGEPESPNLSLWTLHCPQPRQSPAPSVVLLRPASQPRSMFIEPDPDYISP